MTIAQPSQSNNRIAVALSGGVDSAVSAALLQQQGYQVEAFYMKNWSDETDALYRGSYEQCPWEKDLVDVEAICTHLDIPFQSINFEKDYRAKVFSYFLEESKAGRTPNPDVVCNTQIKFLAFLEKALTLGFDKIATGHYARVIPVVGTGRDLSLQPLELHRGVDPNKDQSYFIYHLSQDQLQHIVFPIGDKTKQEVRALAAQFKLPVAQKADSQGLCFIGEIDFPAFLEQYIPHEPGPMVLLDNTPQGKIVGQHKGLPFYTIGQRYGIEIGGTGPYYVVEKRLADNALLICQGKDHPALQSSSLTFSNAHWIAGQPPAASFDCTVKIRYRSPDIACTVTGNTVMLKQPARAVTPGQFAVFYDGDIVLGGGVIEAR